MPPPAKQPVRPAPASRKSLKIALFTYATKPRGSVIHTLELAEALTAQGHTVSIYALDKDGQGFDQSLRSTVHLVPTQPAPNNIDALIQQRIQEFVDYLSAHSSRHDIYHAQDCIGANALLHLRQTGQIPHFVRTIHHVEAYESPYLQQCQDKSIRQPDLRLCVSDRWQQALRDDYGIDAPKVLNGVNTSRFSPQPSGQEANLKQRYGLSGQPIYLTIGGIEPRKNSIRLLQAFAQVQQHFPQAQLVIAGGATLFDYQPYREKFFHQAEQLGIVTGKSLILPGVVPAEDLPSLYRCADAFCFPSVKEGWGLVVMEAIASGLPVITANQAPFTEFLTPDQALLVDPSDVEAIAQAIITVIDPALTKSLQTKSRSVLRHYSWARSAQMHLQQYEALLQSHHASC